MILFNFHGDIQSAIQQTNYEWLMFYPCLYCFAAWDAYQDSKNKKTPYLFMPFVFAAFFVTVGVIYSTDLKIMEFYLALFGLSY